ncbi:GATA transcription factor 9 [Nymphaea thermarum]|nr:GATA transcription factor 9 [Nymphaea thermarum]
MAEAQTELSADLFDQIDDLLDFPIEDIDGMVGDGREFWRGSDHVLGSEHDHPGGELSIPLCDDMAELDWFSNFVEDSFSAGNDHGNSSPFHDSQLRPSSPISVLESSSCSSKALAFSGDAALLSLSVPGRARSKRPRPPAFSPRTTTTGSPFIISPTSSVNTNPSPFPRELESVAESAPPKKMSKRKAVEGQASAAARKCLHCGSQKTPQWRAGPLGPKTLCNACGVRYKSGRLFPEYRPAASPTFVASKHSNSHRKVMEMRTTKRAPDSGEAAEETEFVFRGSAVAGRQSVCFGEAQS